jgi:predicted nuclease with TOPRIM domain
MEIFSRLCMAKMYTSFKKNKIKTLTSKESLRQIENCRFKKMNEKDEKEKRKMFKKGLKELKDMQKKEEQLKKLEEKKQKLEEKIQKLEEKTIKFPIFILEKNEHGSQNGFVVNNADQFNTEITKRLIKIDKYDGEFKMENAEHYIKICGWEYTQIN